MQEHPNPPAKGLFIAYEPYHHQGSNL